MRAAPAINLRGFLIHGKERTKRDQASVRNTDEKEERRKLSFTQGESPAVEIGLPSRGMKWITGLPVVFSSNQGCLYYMKVEDG